MCLCSICLCSKGKSNARITQPGDLSPFAGDWGRGHQPFEVAQTLPWKVFGLPLQRGEFASVT